MPSFLSQRNFHLHQTKAGFGGCRVSGARGFGIKGCGVDGFFGSRLKAYIRVTGCRMRVGFLFRIHGFGFWGLGGSGGLIELPKNLFRVTGFPEIYRGALKTAGPQGSFWGGVSTIVVLLMAAKSEVR